MANRKGIPRELSSIQNREEFSNRVMRKNTDKKLTSLLRCEHEAEEKEKRVGTHYLIPPDSNTVDDQANRPAIPKLNDFIKGGTYIVDQKEWELTARTRKPNDGPFLCFHSC
jgi:hypothetical protein